MFVRLLCCALLTLLTLFGSTAFAAPALQEPLYGAEAILYCAESGQTLYEKNDVPAPPASVTKPTTALLVLEQVDDLSKTVTVSDTAVQIERDSTHIGLVAEERSPCRTCLMQHSCNRQTMLPMCWQKPLPVHRQPLPV